LLDKRIITETMVPGVVNLPHRWGHHREGMRLSIAFFHTGVSMEKIA
jgi:hypothetical protein